jgi:hypothetical protein
VAIVESCVRPPEPEELVLVLVATWRCAAGSSSSCCVLARRTSRSTRSSYFQGRMEPNVFDFERNVPYAYTLFAISRR